MEYALMKTQDSHALKMDDESESSAASARLSSAGLDAMQEANSNRRINDQKTSGDILTDTSELQELAQTKRSSDWSLAKYKSPVDGLKIEYKERQGEADKPARVFVGGLALAESYEPLFSSGPPQAGSEFFVWLRGQGKTDWAPTQKPLDADARDLAAMITKAAKESNTGKSDLVLHSYGTVVFQRMLQLRGEDRVDDALSRISRVTMLNANSHAEGGEKLAGPEFVQRAQATKLFVDGLDAYDASIKLWETTAKTNPLLALQMYGLINTAKFQRTAGLNLAIKEVVDLQRKDLSEPWQSKDESLRKDAQAELESVAKNPDWQEAVIRRSRDVFVLDMKKSDFEYLRNSGIKLDIIQGSDDKLLPWAGTRGMLELMGVDAPEKAPAPGSKFKSPDGSISMQMVKADHYFPLKQPEKLKEILANK